MAAKKKSGYVHYADMTGAAKVKRTAELLKNPGTRSLVATKDLPKGYDPAFIKKRQMAEKFRAPITEGSSLTYGQVASESKDAANVQFGPNAVANSQQLEKDTAGWYDDFQKQLAQHTQNTERYGQEANTASLGLQNAEGMTAATNPSAENQQVFANARAVRQGLNAAYGSQIADNAASSNKYASLRQNVVAPGNKIGAVLGAKKATSDLQAKIGAYQQDYRNKVRESEAQNVLAQGIAQGKTAAQLAKIASDNANKRAQRAVQKRGQDVTAQTAAEKLAAKTAADAEKLAAKNAEKDKETKVWVGLAKQNALRDELDKATALVAKARKTPPPGVDPKNRRAMGQVLVGNLWKGDPKVLTMALDLAYDGALSRGTVERLKAAHYKIAPIGVKFNKPARPLTAAEKAAAAKALKNPMS
jgi:hypothetical protein